MKLAKKDNKKKEKRKTAVCIVLLAVVILFTTWNFIRSDAEISTIAWTSGKISTYKNDDKVFTAMALSFLVYGCENAENPEKTVKNILKTEKMGIIIENADIKREDKSVPESALISSAEFIENTVGDFRFLTALKDEKNGFYGAAFADDENKTVWIAYSGSVSLVDAIESIRLAVGAAVSGQEKCAVELYEMVLSSKEIEGGYNLILTGHSLGGGLAATVSYLSGCEAVTVSGADGLAISKYSDISDKSTENLRISNYLTSPDNGKFAMLDIVQRMMFWGDNGNIETHIYKDNGMVENAHCVFGFVEFSDGDVKKPKLPEEIEE